MEWHIHDTSIKYSTLSMIEIIIPSTKMPQFQSHNAYAKMVHLGKGGWMAFLFSVLILVTSKCTQE